MVGKDKIIELLARCLEDLFDWSSTQRLQTKSKLSVQNYITINLLRRINDNVLQRINADQVLSAIITPIAWYEDPYLLSPQFIEIGNKYVTTWKKINAYLLGKDAQWWNHISIKWMKKTGESIFNHQIHTQRTRDRENWESTRDHLPLNEDIQHLIFTYL